MIRAARPVRPTAAEIDALVLDAAAELFARRGARETSVQAVADATGFSKTGLLRRFPSKDALIDAALQQCIHLTEEVHARVITVNDTHERDAAALAGLVDLALVHPGWAQVVLASIPPVDDIQLKAGLSVIGNLVSELFQLDDHTELSRLARVAGMLGALVTLTLTYEETATATEARPVILEICWATLGHTTTTTTTSPLDK
ncbi:TetR/AcrR family transcriptional regulator [Microbacterium arborescens]|uniref:TetR/AcrR family transcriptional regulator n=1 Tax=Microbacterium arborescens TaxID=33883 RepID=UPI002788764B|nr:helix-turn-helix domain-containing protein [Microbacterium arborescens]MDQ1218027.1 AcrR family transcriptional regulator [Microbacterium arborescens]